MLGCATANPSYNLRSLDMKLSLCMIVKNEEEKLPRCLSSVSGLVDEVILVDTGSTDRTVTIAQSFNAKVHFFEWCHYFSAARNVSLSPAQGEWILVLDADEVLVPEVIPMLRGAIEDPHHLVVNLLRQEIGAMQSPYSLVSRLFRRHPSLHFSHPYHETIDDSVMQVLSQEVQWRVVDLPHIAILHDGYQIGTIAQRDKFATAQVTMEGFLAQHPNDPYICGKLGSLYVQLGELERGINLLERGLKLATEPAIVYELYYHAGIAQNRHGKSQQAEYHYQTALQQAILPQLKLGAYNNLGNLYKDGGDLSAAEVAYEATLEIDPGFIQGHYNLAMTFKAMGNIQQAIGHYQQAIVLNPDFAEAYQNLGIIWLKLGQVETALQTFRQAFLSYQKQQSPKAEKLYQNLKAIGFDLKTPT